MWRSLIVVVWAFAGIEVRTASACTCAVEFQLPASDTVEIPVNLRDLVLTSFSSADEYELRDDALDQVVPFGMPAPVWGTSYPVHLVPLAAPLQPNTTYTLRRSQLVVGQFRTTEAPDETPPGAVGFVDLAIDYVDQEEPGDSCGVNHLDHSGRLELPPDAASVWVRFRGGGQVQQYLLPAYATVLGELNTSVCAVRIALEPDTTYELDVWARDLAGNEGPVTTTSVYIRNTGGGGCAATPSSSLLLCALSLMIRRRRVAGVQRRA